jgi:uncharacterized repeat protein (TIGR04138 family)
MSNEADLLSAIQSEFIDSGRDGRYRLPAYTFVMQGLEFCFAKIGQKKHVTGQTLAGCLAEFAHRQFGPLAYEVLHSWGVRATDDFGFIVYNLIDIGAMSNKDSDAVEDFFKVFDLKGYFEGIDYYSIDKKHIRYLQGA